MLRKIVLTQCSQCAMARIDHANGRMELRKATKRNAFVLSSQNGIKSRFSARETPAGVNDENELGRLGWLHSADQETRDEHLACVVRHRAGVTEAIC